MFVCLFVFNLAVSPETSVQVSPINNIFNFEDNTTITCSFLGGLNNTIVWSKDGEDIDGESEPQIIITNVSSSDGGLYTCTVSNNAGSGNASTSLLVAPYFITHPSEVLARNDTVRSFSCLAEAFPEPMYNWFRLDAQEIRSTVKGKTDSTLIFDPILFGDEGVYYCVATSNNVTRSSTAAILVGELPSIPPLLQMCNTILVMVVY